MHYALTIVFWCNTLFAAWVVFRSGAQWLHAVLPPSLLVGRHRAPRTVDRLRAFVGALWGVHAWSLWVVLGA